MKLLRSGIRHAYSVVANLAAEIRRCDWSAVEVAVENFYSFLQHSDLIGLL